MFYFYIFFIDQLRRALSSIETGEKLDAINDVYCEKEKAKLSHHNDFIPSDELKREDLTAWNKYSLPGKITPDFCFTMIKCFVPLCVRLESSVVSGKRPLERYPLCQRRGRELSGCTNFGSGYIESTMSMIDWFVCVDCEEEWSLHCEKGVYECPSADCEKKWRVISKESGKCPRCDFDTRRDKQGKLRCVGDLEVCLCARCGYEWSVVGDDVGGKCPGCKKKWWKSGEKDVCRCPKCGKEVQKGCVCHGCLASGKREEKWWKITILSARQVVFDKNEWSRSDVIFFDDGDRESKPLKLSVGNGGTVSFFDIDKDSCSLQVYTCNSKLVGKLEDALNEKARKCERMRNLKHESVQADRRHVWPCVVVGYPHGGQCHVTLGTSDTRDDSMGVIHYDVNTCPGSAGSIVYRFGAKDELIHLHSGVLIENPKIGVSTVISVFFE